MKINSKVKTLFPNMDVIVREIRSVTVKKRNLELENFKHKIVHETKEKYCLNTLKDVPTFRHYRHFFWRIGIDPTKNRPASEALIRRILQGNTIPTINTLVDAYNLASIKTEVALAAFDLTQLHGNLLMRQSIKGESFLGIGIKKPLTLQGGEIVISDDENLIALYPHRDAETSKITTMTKDVLLMVCGVPNLSGEILLKAAKVMLEYVTKFCGGEEKT